MFFSQSNIDITMCKIAISIFDRTWFSSYEVLSFAVGILSGRICTLTNGVVQSVKLTLFQFFSSSFLQLQRRYFLHHRSLHSLKYIRLQKKQKSLELSIFSIHFLKVFYQRLLKKHRSANSLFQHQKLH